jgi:tetratricopeptide (TPR) repeat protein
MNHHFSPLFFALSAMITVASGFLFCDKLAEEQQIRGFERSMANDPVGAVACYNQAIMLKPKLFSAYLNRAQAERDLGADTAALKDVNDAIKLGQSNKEFLTMAYTIRGYIKVDLNDKQGAIEDFTHALTLDPPCESDLNPISFGALNNRGQLRTVVGDTANGIRDLTEAIRLDPNSACSYRSRATALNDMGDLQGALRDLDKSISLDETNFGAFHDRAMIKSKLGNKAGARADFSKASRLNPNQAESYADGPSDRDDDDQEYTEIEYENEVGTTSSINCIS